MHDDPNAKVYHVSHRGVRHGPFSRIELSARTMTHDMLVWREGMPNWIPVADVEELRAYVQHAAITRTTVPPRTVRRRQSEPRATAMIPPPPPVPAPLRSTAATTLGILNIVIASLTLLCWPPAVLLNLVGSNDGSPFADVLDRPDVRYGQAASFGVGFLLAVPMLISGIGLVRRRLWGRIMAIACAWCGLALQAASFMFMLAVAVVPMAGIAAELDDPEIWGGAFGLLVGNVLSTVGGVVYDLVVLIVMGRTGVKDSLS